MGPIATLLLFLFVSPLLFFAGAFTGICIGIGRMPDWYMNSPFGVRWLKLSGADKPAQARIVAGLIAVLLPVFICLATFVFWKIPQSFG